MVDEPAKHFEAIRDAGGSSVTFHYEAVDDPQAVAAKAREHGLAVGLAFNPETAVEDAAAAADGFDLVLCMSIHPGYSGQEFMPDAIPRIRALRKLLPADVFIQVDGGVGPENVRELYRVGREPARRRHEHLRQGGPAARVPAPRHHARVTT